ncbi:tyrosine-type recombinase/integrase [Microvirga calopogonii]|uniref:tyrosine-type recombinase/integrase n=1 Tax=Microvirga calopogonii TaxID=2078013 RepID=UPI000E0DEF14|nr:tyrosine-type recombinase/integrase [Microvirga calopogonii]
MGRCYSLDLRVRVAGFVEAGYSCHAAGQHFAVSESFAITLVRRTRDTGSPAPARQGRQRARMPIPPDVGAAIVSYLRNGRPTSPCRRLFLRTLAPHVGFASGCAITMVAKMALERAGISGYAHQGAHIFRHSLATELLRSGATLAEIGQLLRHESHDTTRIYAKVDIETLRTLSLPGPGAVQ